MQLQRIIRRIRDDPASAPDRIRRRIRQQIEPKLFQSSRVRRIAARQFHRAYYYSPETTWQDTKWLGTVVWKCPLDLWIYQEILTEVRPDIIVECGTRSGGSALYFASICDLLDSGRIITIDIEVLEGRPLHPRITYVTGSSTEPDVVAQVKDAIHPGDRVLVILDSDHRCSHVFAELRTYADIVSPSSYLIVEDTSLNGHPVQPAHGPGPHEAVAAFLEEHSAFARDDYWSKFLVSFNPGGYLKKESVMQAPSSDP